MKKVEEDDYVELYRAVGAEEYEQIMKTNKFEIIDNAMESKQFGNNFAETLSFANNSFNKHAVAIIGVKVP